MDRAIKPPSYQTSRYILGMVSLLFLSGCSQIDSEQILIDKRGNTKAVIPHDGSIKPNPSENVEYRINANISGLALNAKLNIHILPGSNSKPATGATPTIIATKDDVLSVNYIAAPDSDFSVVIEVEQPNPLVDEMALVKCQKAATTPTKTPKTYGPISVNLTCTHNLTFIPNPVPLYARQYIVGTNHIDIYSNRKFDIYTTQETTATKIFSEKIDGPNSYYSNLSRIGNTIIAKSETLGFEYYGTSQTYAGNYSNFTRSQSSLIREKDNLELMGRDRHFINEDKVVYFNADEVFFESLIESNSISSHKLPNDIDNLTIFNSKIYAYIENPSSPNSFIFYSINEPGFNFESQVNTGNTLLRSDKNYFFNTKNKLGYIRFANGDEEYPLANPPYAIAPLYANGFNPTADPNPSYDYNILYTYEDLIVYQICDTTILAVNTSPTDCTYGFLNDENNANQPPVIHNDFGGELISKIMPYKDGLIIMSVADQTTNYATFWHYNGVSITKFDFPASVVNSTIQNTNIGSYPANYYNTFHIVNDDFYAFVEINNQLFIFSIDLSSGQYNITQADIEATGLLFVPNMMDLAVPKNINFVGYMDKKLFITTKDEVSSFHTETKTSHYIGDL